jgi:hypothetical protein
MENIKIKKRAATYSEIAHVAQGCEACFNLIQVANGWSLALGGEVGATSFR